VADVGHVKLVNNVAGKIPAVLVDRRRLSKVFVEFDENAIQHSPPGAVVSVEAAEYHEGNQHGWIARSKILVTAYCRRIWQRSLNHSFPTQRRYGIGTGDR
jgi:hypothetical protein